MKYLLIVGLALASLSLSAQDCLYEKNDFNAFDEETEKLTQAVIIARKVKREAALPLRKVMVQFRQIGEERYFVLKFPVTMVMSPTFTDNSSRNHLILLLENKERIKLPLANLMKNQEDKVEFRYATDFVLDYQDLQLLKEYEITDIRVGMKNNTFDIELMEGAGALVKESVGCVE